MSYEVIPEKLYKLPDNGIYSKKGTEPEFFTKNNVFHSMHWPPVFRGLVKGVMRSNTEVKHIVVMLSELRLVNPECMELFESNQAGVRQ